MVTGSISRISYPQHERDINSCGFYSVLDCVVSLLPASLHSSDPKLFRSYNPQLTEMALQPTMDAPKFKGTAVVDGQFKEISLDDYKGEVST